MSVPQNLPRRGLPANALKLHAGELHARLNYLPAAFRAFRSLSSCVAVGLDGRWSKPLHNMRVRQSMAIG